MQAPRNCSRELATRTSNIVGEKGTDRRSALHPYDEY
jgi:hypothetical protein